MDNWTRKYMSNIVNRFQCNAVTATKGETVFIRIANKPSITSINTCAAVKTITPRLCALLLTFVTENFLLQWIIYVQRHVSFFNQVRFWNTIQKRLYYIMVGSGPLLQKIKSNNLYYFVILILVLRCWIAYVTTKRVN